MLCRPLETTVLPVAPVLDAPLPRETHPLGPLQLPAPDSICTDPLDDIAPAPLVTSTAPPIPDVPSPPHTIADPPALPLPPQIVVLPPVLSADATTLPLDI